MTTVLLQSTLSVVPATDDVTERILRAIRNELVAAYAVLVWDWLLCLKHDADLLSHPTVSLAKLAYLWCRYWPLLTYPAVLWVQGLVTDPTICQHVFRIPLFLSIFNFAGAAAVLIVRVYAFTGRRGLVVTILVGTFVLLAVYQFIVVTREIIPGPLRGCFPTRKTPDNHALSGYYLSPLIFDVIATMIFIIHIMRLKIPYTGFSHVVRVFIREGVVYFIAISAINLGNTVVDLRIESVAACVLVPMSRLLPNVLACRLFVNLRSASAEESSFTRVLEDTGSTAINFHRKETRRVVERETRDENAS